MNIKKQVMKFEFRNDPPYRFALFLGLAWALFFLAGCMPLRPQSAVAEPTADGELASVLKNGLLVIATEADFPPQSQLNLQAARASDTRCGPSQYTASQMSGFDIDVAVEIAARLGVEPCFVTPTWSQVIAGSWGDRWDINVGSMVITPERMKNLYFTQPYISGEAVLFVRKDNQTFKTPQDLSDKRIGVCSGCTYEAYLDGTLKIPGQTIDFQIKNAQVVGYDTDTSALVDLAAGNSARLDAVLTDPDTGRSAIQGGLAIKQLNGAVYHDFSSVSIDKNSVRNPLGLLKRLSAIIQDMHKDGTLRKLSQKYYAGDYSSLAEKFDFNTLGQVP